MLARILSALVVAFALSGAAHAQLVGLTHVWTVPGIQNTAAGIATVIACTNGGTASQTIGVDLYGPAGTYVDGDSLSVAAQATVLFGTTAVPGTSLDVDIAAPTISKGHARVYGTTSRGILCSAYLAATGSGLPTASLSVVKKTAQKGD